MTEYAVLIPVITTEEGDALLLEVRSDKVKQPGEICFPGGRVESGETQVQAAVRETCEELGIGAEEIMVTAEPDLEVMGDGRKVWTVTARLSRASIDHIKLSEREVAEVFLLPATWVRRNPPEYYDLATTDDDVLPEKLRDYLSHYGSFRRTGETYYWEYKGRGIWGLTARIIRKWASQ